MPVYEIGSENLPNVYITKIVAYRDQNDTLNDITKVKVFLTLKDKLDINNVGYWYNTDILGEFLKIRVALVAESGIIQPISRNLNEGNMLFLESNLQEQVNNYLASDLAGPEFSIVEIAATSAEDEDQNLGHHVDSQGNKIIDKHYEATLEVENGKQNLHVYACAFVQMEGQGGLITQYNLDLSGYPTLHYMGPLTGEVVIKDNNLVYGSNEFRTSVGQIWSGPVHETSASPYQSGARSGYLYSESLNLNELAGTKTEELMSIDNIIFGDQPIEEQETIMDPFADLQNYLADELNIPPSGPYAQAPVMPYNTDIFVAKIPEDYVNGSFFIDLDNLAVQTSYVAERLYDANKTYFSMLSGMCSINYIDILRSEAIGETQFNSLYSPMDSQMSTQANPRYVIASSHDNSPFLANKVMRRFSNGMEFTLDESKLEELDDTHTLELDQGNISKSTFLEAKRIGEIKEINVLGQNLRLVNFTDYEIPDLNGSEFRYSYNLSVTNPYDEFVLGKLQGLRNAKAHLDLYYENTLIPGNYDIFRNKLSNKLIVDLNEQYNIILNSETLENISPPSVISNLKTAPWIAPIKVFLDCSKLLRDLSLTGMETIRARLLNNLNPFRASSDSILNVINLFDELETRILEYYKLDNNLDNLASASQGNINSGLQHNVFEVSADFTTIVSNRVPANSGYEFIEGDNSSGLMKIDKKMFEKRIDQERQKFFNENRTAGGNLGLSTNPEINDLKSFSSAYFSPTRVRMGAQVLKLDKIDGDALKPEIYKELQIYKGAIAARSGLASRNYSINLIENVNSIASNLGVVISTPLTSSVGSEQDIYVEAQEYIGETSKFLIQDQIEKRKVEDFELQEIEDHKFEFLSSFVNNVKSNNPIITSIADLDISRKDNTILNSFKDTEGPGSVRAIPLQVKALMLSRGGQSTFVKSIAASSSKETFITPEEETEVDILNNTDTENIVEENCMNIQEIQYFNGFKKVNELNDLNQIEWKILPTGVLEGIQSSNLFCRMEGYEESRLGIATNPNLASMQIYNSFFVIAPETVNENLATQAGRTSYDENHSHEFLVDVDGNGETSWVYRSETQEIGHKHEIVNGVILEAQSDCYPNCTEQYGFSGVGPHAHYLPDTSSETFVNNTIQMYESGFVELEYSTNIIVRQHANYSGIGSLFGAATITPVGNGTTNPARQTLVNSGPTIPMGGTY